jgi:hypothetical protein
MTVKLANTFYMYINFESTPSADWDWHHIKGYFENREIMFMPALQTL